MGILSTLRALARRPRAETDLDDELRFHLEMETAENVRRGMAPDEARRAAAVAFGGEARVREECRDARPSRPLEDVGRDLRYALRVLRRAPGFAAVAILTLALGIGSATAVFSLLDGVLLRPLPYPDADRLFRLNETDGGQGVRTPSYPAFRDWRAETKAFSGMAYVRGGEFVVRGPEGVQRLVGGYASEEFFAAVGTKPLLGRTFGERGERELVISHGLWSREYGGERSVIGRQVSTVDGPFTIVGVMPPGFRLPFWADVWAPISALPPGERFVLTDRALHVDAEVIGRAAPGVSRERATAELAALSARQAAAHPERDGTRWDRALLTPIPETVLGNAAERLRVLALAVGLLLVVACVNVAGLMLARASTRSREVAVRVALGAGRGRIVRQLLVESVVLGLAGGALGAAIAWLGVRALRASAPGVLPRMAEVTVDGRVLAFAIVLSIATALVSGLAPALRATSPELVQPLKGGTPGAGAGRATVRARTALVVAEISLALVLVAGAGLLARSLWALNRVELGFEPRGLAAVRIFPPSPRYDAPEAAEALYRRLHEAVTAVPGVESAAFANHAPLVGGAVPTRLIAHGQTAPAQGENVVMRTVSQDYFRTMGTRVVRGRGLGGAEMPGAGGVVINEAAARAFFPGVDALGRSVTLHRAAQGRENAGQPITAEVVGIAADERFFGIEGDPPPAVFVPWTWDVWTNVTLLARTDGDVAALVPALRRAVLAVDPDLPVAGPMMQSRWTPMESYVRSRLEVQRLNATLLGVFAASAFALAVIGVFGVMAYVVAQRTREMGLRMALGARPRDVLWMVARQALALSAVGIVVGLGGALAATRLLRSQLHGVSATDPTTFVAVAVAFAGAALLAGLLPARRASRVDPMTALRVD
ncbi:MAG TPA: ABC transporter permease [Longimicrobium sp.]|nr:ABC transporter permease [Longimicrobium sp.]